MQPMITTSDIMALRPCWFENEVTDKMANAAANAANAAAYAANAANAAANAAYAANAAKQEEYVLNLANILTNAGL